MIACAKCGSNELLVIRTRLHVDFVKRWRFFGKIVPRMRVNTLDLVCSECLYAFIASPGRVIEAPGQEAHEQLRAARQGQMNGPAPDAKEPAPRNIARPAGDPRVKQRR